MKLPGDRGDSGSREERSPTEAMKTFYHHGKRRKKGSKGEREGGRKGGKEGICARQECTPAFPTPAGMPLGLSLPPLPALPWNEIRVFESDVSSNSWSRVLAEWAWARHLMSPNPSLKGGLSARTVTRGKSIQRVSTVGIKTK